MTKLILSTGNIVSGGPSIIRKPGAYRSNLELTNSLRSNFLAAQQAAAADIEADIAAEEDGTLSKTANGHAAPNHSTSSLSLSNGNSNCNGSAHAGTCSNGTSTRTSTSIAASTTSRRPPLAAWTQREGSVLYVPRLDWASGTGAGTEAGVGAGAGTSLPDGVDGAVPGLGLQEEASQYDTTVKLFFVSGARGATAAERGASAEEALGLVFRELGVSRVDLLVISFPGISLEGGVDGENNGNSNDNDNDKDNEIDDDELVAATWAATAEALHAQGKVARLGVAEFGGDRLDRLLGRARVPPAVDQVNLRQCCNVPPALGSLARERGIELLVHTDCTDVLPPGTLRELLGPGLQGASVLAGGPGDAAAADATADAAADDGLRGDLTPQWVIKYTAVVRDRGVIENKGYFAGAELRDV